MITSAVDALSGLLGEPAKALTGRRARASDRSVDAVVRSGSFLFAVECKRSAGVAPVLAAIEQLRRYVDETPGRLIPLLVVPYMGQVGRKRCEQAGVSWLDLSGNASIQAPGLHVLVEGKPNRFKRRGRPSSAFAPNSSRIARWLLMHPRQAFTQRELARSTGVDEGFTSRIVGRLEQDGLVQRASDGTIQAPDPDALLDAWSEEYDFTKHHLVAGHVAARSGDELLVKTSRALAKQRIEHAATGLAGAWLLTHFAAFRIATFYLREPPSSGLLQSLSFREEARGANLWLVSPNDDGVLHGATDHDGVPCAHPVQVYLDLAHHPERAEEAAARVRSDRLTWKSHG